MNRSDTATTRVIAGYEVFRFGVPMIGEYVNTGRGRRVPISPAVPGAQYRITAWAIGDGRRSPTRAVKSVTTGEAGAFYVYIHTVESTVDYACDLSGVVQYVLVMKV